MMRRLILSQAMFLSAVLSLAPLTALVAQDRLALAATHHDMQLDGNESYIELPSNILHELTIIWTAGQGSTVPVTVADPEMRDLTTRLLGKQGYRVTCAANGKEGIELAKQIQPAVITLDVMMPELDGFGFMDGLRKLPGCHQVPVIVITAKDITPEDRQRLNGQVTRILQKAAYSQKELLAEIRSLVKP